MYLYYSKRVAHNDNRKWTACIGQSLYLLRTRCLCVLHYSPVNEVNTPLSSKCVPGKDMYGSSAHNHSAYWLRWTYWDPANLHWPIIVGWLSIMELLRTISVAFQSYIKLVVWKRTEPSRWAHDISTLKHVTLPCWPCYLEMIAISGCSIKLLHSIRLCKSTGVLSLEIH